MAFSYQKYNGDGATREFAIPFGYLSRDHIFVRVGGVLKTVTTHYIFLTPATIQFTVPETPATGVLNVEVRRETPKDSPFVDYEDGAALHENDLDNGLLSVLYISQEAFDEAADIQAGIIPAEHAVEHMNGGDDEIDVTNLSGLLADAQTPLAHKTSHQNGGSDEISVAGLSGELTDKQKLEVQKAGSVIGTRPELNLIEGVNITINAADNSGEGRVDVTITATGGSYKAVGLRGKNADADPDNDFEFSAEVLVLRNPSNGEIHIIANTGTVTCATDLTGPAANGRDQAGAFSADSWVHFYFIWNGSTLASLSSAVAPPTGPTLPDGYTHWAYVGAVRYKGDSTLTDMYLSGRVMMYQTRAQAVNPLSATSDTEVDISALIPPNAMEWQGAIDNIVAVSDGSGNVTLTAFIRPITGVNWIVAVMALTGLSATTAAHVTGPSWQMVNVGQAFWYQMSVAVGSDPSGSAFVLSYSVPNGGE